MDSKLYVNNPYHFRPWMQNHGAAAPAGSGNIGFKGIIAGKFTLLDILSRYERYDRKFLLIRDYD